MATFTGTNADELITPTSVSPSVTADGAAMPTSGIDTIFGRGGDDIVDGGGGNDVAFLGSGNDRFLWSPGGGSDTIEGQTGADLLDFSASAANEIVQVSANGTRTRLTRDIASVTLDFNGIENILIHAFGGLDNLTIGDLSGTAVERVTINLEGTLGSAAGDGQADVATVHGRGTADTLSVTSAANIVTVSGLPWLVKVHNAEAADRLQIFSGGGKDVINAAGLASSAIGLTVDLGDGDDSVLGSVNADVILGGNGRDSIDGDQGNDTAFLGVASDIFFWHVGDGNDVVEGQSGNDKIDFTGSAASENIDIAANGGRVRIFRDVSAVTLDIDDVERLFFRALNGADNFVVGDLSGTDVRRVDIDLASGIAEQDSVTVQGTNGDDTVILESTNGMIAITGLTADTFIRNFGAQDRLVINGSGGADVINASALPAGPGERIFNGGLGNDIFFGSAGNDTVTGSDGNDTAFLGNGNDRFTWAPGDDNDMIEGQDGSDLLDFAGANIAENITISANGGRALFFRDIANVTMDLDDVERILYHAFGGADRITVNDLSNTDVTQVTVNLEGLLGSGTGDGQVDLITVQGRTVADNIAISALGNGITMTGMPWKVTVLTPEASDQIRLSTGAGNDTITLAGLSSAPDLRIDSGTGNDTLTGGAADDVFVFSTALNSSTNVDTMKSFAVASDLMQLDDAVFAGIGAPGALSGTAFHIGSAATDTTQRIIYDDSDGKLYFDADGSAGGAAIQFAKLTAGLSLSAGNFEII
jgi:Ca2+-binding RTX toxin-like protein